MLFIPFFSRHRVGVALMPHSMCYIQLAKYRGKYHYIAAGMQTFQRSAMQARRITDWQILQEQITVMEVVSRYHNEAILGIPYQDILSGLLPLPTNISTVNAVINAEQPGVDYAIDFFINQRKAVCQYVAVTKSYLLQCQTLFAHCLLPLRVVDVDCYALLRIAHFALAAKPDKAYAAYFEEQGRQQLIIFESGILLAKHDLPLSAKHIETQILKLIKESELLIEKIFICTQENFSLDAIDSIHWQTFINNHSAFINFPSNFNHEYALALALAMSDASLA